MDINVLFFWKGGGFMYIINRWLFLVLKDFVLLLMINEVWFYKVVGKLMLW